MEGREGGREGEREGGMTVIRPPTGVAQRRPGGLFHVMRRIIQGSVSYTIRLSRGWLAKD